MKCHWNCEEQQVSLSNLTKYTVPATKNHPHHWSLSQMKCYLQRRATNATLPHPQILCLPRKMILMIHPLHIWNVIYNAGTVLILQHHQILHLPRKITLIIDPCHIWNAIYNARSNNCHPPTSPNTAPATKNDSHDSSSSHMKHHLQYGGQQLSSSNFTKYCPWHAKSPSRMWQKSDENSWNVIYNARPIRDRSENDPTMDPGRQELTFRAHQEHFVLKNTTLVSRSGYHSKFHDILRLPRKVIIQLHQILHLPRKVALELHQILHLPRKVTFELH